MAKNSLASFDENTSAGQIFNVLTSYVAAVIILDTIPPALMIGSSRAGLRKQSAAPERAVIE